MAVDHGEGDPALGMAVRLRHLGLDDQPVALRRGPRTRGGTRLIHKGMSKDAQARPGAGQLLVKARLGVGDRGMGHVRPLLAGYVDLGIAISGLV